MRWIQLGLCAASLCGFASVSEAQSPNYQTRNGAILGGVTGGVIGGIVGHQRGDTAEGALIGGAVGAIAGGVLGNNKDNADRKLYQQQQYQARHYHSHSRPVVVTSPTVVERRTYVPVSKTVTTAVRKPVTVSEVITMAQSGVSDSVIVSHLQTNGLANTPDVNEVIWMSEKGVSDYVITFMQQNSKVVPAPIVSANREVVIQEVSPTTTVIETVPTYRTATPVYVERRGF